MPKRQPTNTHQLRIGDFVLTTLLDVQMEASFGLVQSIPEEEARRLHAETPGPPRRASPLTPFCWIPAITGS